jgi:hypothetical protein
LPLPTGTILVDALGVVAAYPDLDPDVDALLAAPTSRWRHRGGIDESG